MVVQPVILVVGDARGILDNALGAELKAWFGSSYKICISARDHVEAILRLFDEARVPLAVCIADVGGQGAKAFDLLARLGKTHPLALRAAVVDADQQETAVKALVREHIDRYLVRGCNPDELKKTVQTLLDRHQSLRRLEAAITGKLGKHIFFTGATGFVGSYLVHEILRCTDAKVTCLTRGTGDTPFDQRLPFRAEDFPGRLEFFEGDVTEPNLGLNFAQEFYLQESVDEVWHLAAVTSFNEKLRDKIMHVNVRGTKAVLNLAESCQHLRLFNYVSTAYVAGNRTLPDISLEELTANPPGFKNPYEESKWYAEHLVEASGLPFAIYRPSILIGESYSGRSDGKTVYGAAKIVHMARMLACSQCASCENGAATFRMAGAAGASLNVMPVDWVVDQFLRLRAGNTLDRAVFHVVHPTPVTTQDLMRAIAESLEIEKWEFVPQLASDDLCWAEAIMLKGLRVFRDYMTLDDPVFDRTNSTAVLGDVNCPPLELDFLRFCIQSYYDQYADSYMAQAGSGFQPAGAAASI